MNLLYAITFCALRSGLSKSGTVKNASAIFVGLGSALALIVAACTPTVSDSNPTPASERPAAASQSTIAPRLADSKALRIENFVVREESGQTILLLKFSKPISEFRHFPLTQPSRIVLDIFGDAVVPAGMESFRIESNLVNNIRFTAGQDSTRVTVDVTSSGPPVYLISPHDGGLRILVGTADPKIPARPEQILVQAGRRVDSVAAQASNVCPEVRPVISEVSEPIALEKKYIGDKITLDFKDADIRNIFRILGEVSKKNMVVTDEVNRRVTLRLIEVPWDQALDLVIDTNGLAKEEVGNVVRISSAARIAKERRELQDARKAVQGAEIPQLSYLKVNYAEAKVLAERARQLIKTGAEIVPDDRSNTLVVKGTKSDLDQIICIVAKLDVRTSQVLIESNLIETTPSFSRSLGIEMETLFNGGRVRTSGRFMAEPPFSGGAQPVPAVNQLIIPASGFRFGYFGNNITSVLSAAEQEGNVRIISRPSVVTLNNVKSTIKSERILRIPIESGGTSIGAAPQTQAAQDIPVGITLEVTPQVSSDGYVLMKIDVKSSTLGTQSAGSVIPDELSRQAIVSVLVRDGETIVIGGIMKDTNANSEGGIPYLKDIPVLGWLFKNIRLQKDFEELVVFITPRIVAAGSGDLPTAEQLWREQMKSTEGARNLSIPAIP